jgi:hypothetical protein
MSEATLETQTESFFGALERLRADSSPESLQSFGRFFNKDCIANPISMREHLDVKHGCQQIVDAYKETVQNVQLVEHRILSRIIDESQRMVACEMKNRMLVDGQVLDPFYETAIIHFDTEGSIVKLNMYSCRSPIVALLQKTTGLGLYADARYIDSSCRRLLTER